MLHGEFPGLIEKAKAQAEAAQHCHEGDHDMESNQYSNAAAAYKFSMQLDPSNMEYKQSTTKPRKNNSHWLTSKKEANI